MANTLLTERLDPSREEKAVPLPTCEKEEHVAPPRVSPRPTEETLERAAEIFRAAGYVMRLRMLDLLMDGEQCVTTLAQILGAGMSTVSQQLRVLRRANIVTTRHAGKHIFYALADDHVRDIVVSVLAHASHCEPLSAGMEDELEESE